MRISDWSSDVCSSDLARVEFLQSSARLGADFHGDASCPCLIGGGLRARRGGRGMRPCRGVCKQQQEAKGNSGVPHSPCSSNQTRSPMVYGSGGGVGGGGAALGG